MLSAFALVEVLLLLLASLLSMYSAVPDALACGPFVAAVLIISTVLTPTVAGTTPVIAGKLWCYRQASKTYDQPYLFRP
jgi:hypothetical protein